MNNRFTAYNTRHMPTSLHARLKAVVEERNVDGRRKITLEDIVNEALELGVERMEADRPRRRPLIDWSQTPDTQEEDD